jgi:hypothetical protein
MTWITSSEGSTATARADEVQCEVLEGTKAIYLAKSWTENPSRRAAAGVPDEVEFATKPALARGMITGFPDPPACPAVTSPRGPVSL